MPKATKAFMREYVIQRNIIKVNMVLHGKFIWKLPTKTFIEYHVHHANYIIVFRPMSSKLSKVS